MWRMGMALAGYASNGHVEEAKGVIAQGADMNFELNFMFRVAAQFVQPDFLWAMLDYNLDADKPAQDRQERLDMALAGAASSGQIEMARELISRGANVEGFRNLPLRLALVNHEREFFKFLIADCDVKMSDDLLAEIGEAHNQHMGALMRLQESKQRDADQETTTDSKPETDAGEVAEMMEEIKLDPTEEDAMPVVFKKPTSSWDDSAYYNADNNDGDSEDDEEFLARLGLKLSDQRSTPSGSVSAQSLVYGASTSGLTSLSKYRRA
jgi:hypothetical protein